MLDAHSGATNTSHQVRQRPCPTHRHTHTLTIDSALTDEYYKTEWIYSFLSAGAKLTLGLLLYVSVSCHVSMSVRDMN